MANAIIESKVAEAFTHASPEAHVTPTDRARTVNVMERLLDSGVNQARLDSDWTIFIAGTVIAERGATPESIARQLLSNPILANMR